MQKDLLCFRTIILRPEMFSNGHLCQLVVADIQQREGRQRLQGRAHVFDSVVIKIQDGEVVHALHICSYHLPKMSVNSFQR